MKRSSLHQYRAWPTYYVAMHGLRQIKRGRRPSLPLGKIRDPKEAFKFAWLSWHIAQYLRDVQESKTSLFGELLWVRPGVYSICNKPVQRQVEVIAELSEIAFNLRRQGFAFDVYGTRFSIGPIMFEVELNGVTVRIDASTHCFTLERDRLRAEDGCIEGPVGPRAKRVLSPEERAHDQAVRHENERQRILKEEAYEAELRRRQQVLDARLKTLPLMEVSDSRAVTRWYGKTHVSYNAIRFAQRWARLMQGELAEGRDFPEMAQRSFYEAIGEVPLLGTEACDAARMLFECWVHGPKLKEWVQRSSSHMLIGIVIPA